MSRSWFLLAFFSGSLLTCHPWGPTWAASPEEDAIFQMNLRECRDEVPCTTHLLKKNDIVMTYGSRDSGNHDANRNSIP